MDGQCDRIDSSELEKTYWFGVDDPRVGPPRLHPGPTLVPVARLAAAEGSLVSLIVTP